ncbi:MAG: 50S ribosomal protein L20 [bacterium]
MPRVKRGVTARAKANKVAKQTKGYRGARSRHYKNAHEAVLHSKAYAYRDRRNRKREFRRLWIARISAGVRAQGLTYSVFMDGLKKAQIDLDRKSLSELAIHDPNAFTKLVELVRQQVA